jgi:hypothetical protein
VANYTREAQIAAAVPRDQVYNFSTYILAGMLMLGLVANSLVKPLAEKWFILEAEVAALQAKSAAANAGPMGSFGIAKGGFDTRALIAWAIVGIPLLWGAWVTLRATFALFG